MPDVPHNHSAGSEHCPVCGPELDEIPGPSEADRWPDEWAVADAVILQAYPNWPHIPNHGTLRGAVANAVLAIRSAAETRLSSALASAQGVAADRGRVAEDAAGGLKLPLMCLRLIRQLPRGNPVRKDAENLVLSLGICDLDHILRNDALETSLRGMDDACRRCPMCDGQMHHERLRGWVCGRGCHP